jgi:hypothetical protein
MTSFAFGALIVATFTVGYAAPFVLWTVLRRTGRR